MILKMFAVRDSKGGFYSNPRMHHSHGEAEREMLIMMKNPEALMAQYPEDFDLYYLGDYDALSGKIAPLGTPQHLVKLINLRPQGAPAMTRPAYTEEPKAPLNS
jgi:hypothetical protein